jgi:hypothetical protein
MHTNIYDVLLTSQLLRISSCDEFFTRSSIALVEAFSKRPALKQVMAAA